MLLRPLLLPPAPPLLLLILLLPLLLSLLRIAGVGFEQLGPHHTGGLPEPPRACTAATERQQPCVTSPLDGAVCHWTVVDVV